MSNEWADWTETPHDAPKSTVESRKVRVWNAIGCIIGIPAMFGVWIWCGFAGTADEPAVASAGLPASAPYEGVLVIGCVLLLPLILVALIAGRKP